MKVTKKILIIIDGKERELTEKEAEVLYKQLCKVLDKPEQIILPSLPVPPPHHRYFPPATWRRENYMQLEDLATQRLPTV